MTHCEIMYFKTDRGDEPVREFVDGLDISSKRKYWRKIDCLREFGKSLCEPHAKSLGCGIYELRFRGSDGHFRVLYFFFSSHHAVLTNGFKKKTSHTPKQEIDLAVSRMNSFLASPDKYGL
jgi:phage-related protein